MKTPLLLILTVILCAGKLLAQNNPQRQQRSATVPPPVPTRQVSGIVKDKSDATLPGAVVKLESPKDTMSTATNADGVFIFKNVKSATFVLSVSSLGYKPQVKKMLNNDAVPRLTLDPVVLESATTQLKEVVVNGTPSVVYKTDTVEYRASDYKVRENATVDELLKKMEGMEVGSDGSLTHQGQAVVKARLNGKDFAGGDVAQAIQNLPADIVEKIQVVDDYGDQAARTGIKDGDPQKVLNITTRADRSIGTRGNLTGQGGSNDRYTARINANRLNANQAITFIGNLANAQNGVSQSAGLAGGATNGGGGGGGVGAGARGGSPGTTLSGRPSFSYADQWNKKLQVSSSYSYNFRNNDATSDSYGQRVSTLGPTDFNNHSVSTNDSHGHNAEVKLEYQIDSANYLQIDPSFSLSHSESTSSGLSETINHYGFDTVHNVSGYQHQLNNSSRRSYSNTPSFNATALFSHNFKKPRRVFSVNMSASIGKSESVQDRSNDYKYLDSATNAIVKDSVSHIIANRSSNNSQYRSSITYSEPLSTTTRLDFNGQTTINTQHSIAVNDSLGADGVDHRLSRLDNIFNTTATETRGSLAFRYDNSKLSFGVGSQLIYRDLTGDKVDNSNTGKVVSTSRGDFKIIPVLRASYAWSRTQRLTFNYSGTNTVPDFTEIQPFTDRTDPNNLVTGNQNLKSQFTNSYNVQYNNYFPNSRFNISFGGNATFIDDRISTNVVQLPNQIIKSVDPKTGDTLVTTKRVNETKYINIDGSHSYVGRYQISKQLADRRYNIALNGNITYSYNNAMSNDVSYHTTQWRFDERFGPRLSPTENIEINPSVIYDITRQFTNLKGSTSTNVTTTALSIDGRFYFLKTFMVHYDARQNYVTGLTGLTNTSPLIVNAGFQKQFFPRKQLTITFDVYDILHQSNAIQQTLNDNGGFTNTQSNTLSRYFMFGAILNLQKWSGRPTRGGREMKRRGDGSFIYD